MGQIAVDGVELHVEEVGDGPPLVMLHGGLGIDHTSFRPDFDQLADVARVVYLDHRGNGRSTRTDEPLTIERLADDAAAVIDAVGGSATVLGHSYGGFVAQELALRHPASVDALVLVCTAPGQLGEADDPTADQGPPAPPELEAIFSVVPPTDEEFGPWMDSLLPWWVHGDPSILRGRMGDTILRVEAMHDGFASLATWSVVDQLASLTVPVLVVAGEHDHFTSRQQGERIARLVPGARLEIFDSGHFPWLERPDEFFPLLREWLAAL